MLLTRRRNLMIGAFSMVAAVMALAGVVVFRAVRREMGVAAVQADFLSAVSHELRTPITAMSHLTEMLEGGHAPAERLPRYYAAMGRETRRLHALVEQLLDVGRTEGGARLYDMQRIDVRDLVSTTAEQYAQTAELVPGRFVLAISASDCPVMADSEALSLVVRNLIDNAVKYSPADANIQLAVAASAHRVTITVIDRGAGISKAEQQLIFRKFVRGSAARALNVNGSGFGLAMAHAIVKAHGGRIVVRSVPGLGSTFTVLLRRIR
jgi:signal transduction histidine kinase